MTILDKLKNCFVITPAGHLFRSRTKNINISPFKILVIALLVLLQLSTTVTVIAAPLNSDDEWAAVVVPITGSPAVTVNQVRTSPTQLEPFQKWWSSISADYYNRNKFAWTAAKKFSPAYSTFCGSSCRGMDKKCNGESRNDEKRRDNNKRVKNECGKKRYDRHCGENQHENHCSKKKCDKPFGKIHHEQHCANRRNGQGRNDINCNKQNQQQNVGNGNRRKEFTVNNKVIVKINNVRTPSPTVLRVETTVPVVISTTDKSAGLRSSNFISWIIDIYIIPLHFILVFILLIFCFFCM